MWASRKQSRPAECLADQPKQSQPIRCPSFIIKQLELGTRVKQFKNEQLRVRRSHTTWNRLNSNLYWRLNTISNSSSSKQSWEPIPSSHRPDRRDGSCIWRIQSNPDQADEDEIDLSQACRRAGDASQEKIGARGSRRWWRWTQYHPTSKQDLEEVNKPLLQISIWSNSW